MMKKFSRNPGSTNHWISIRENSTDLFGFSINEGNSGNLGFSGATNATLVASNLSENTWHLLEMERRPDESD